MGYLTVFGADTKLNETIVTMAFMLAGTVITGYCGFATFEKTRPKPE